MLAKFDNYNNYEDLVVSLRQPSDEFIGFVEIKDINISPEFNAVSEMSCSVYKCDNELDIYDAVQIKRQLFVEEKGYFIITECDEVDDDNGQYKTLSLLSCEHELTYKKLNYFKGTYKFYGTFTDDDKEKRGIMDEIMQSLPRWSIGHIDESVAERWRTFDEPDTTLYAFLLDECEEAYECIFEFDIINKLIYVYDKNNYIKKTSICISRDDVITSTKINTKVENVYTAISVYGADDININSLNPTGTSTLYNFSYYKPWMSEGLRNKLTIWENKITLYESAMLEKRLRLSELMTEKQSIQADIDASNQKIVLYEKQIGVDVISEESISTLNALIQEENNKILEYNISLANKTSEIDEINSFFGTVNNECSFENNFTVDEIKELDAYIYESSYVDDNLNITENMTYKEEYDIIKQLYDRGKEVSEDLGYPAEELTIDTNNFIFQKSFQEYTEQLEVGCLIDVIIDKDTDDIVTYVLLKMDVNYDEKTIGLTLGNKYRTSGAETLFKDWQANVSSAASTLTYERSKYGKAVDSGSLDRMDSFMRSNLDLTLNQVKSSDGQSMVISESGIKGKRLNPNTNDYDPEQIWITSNNIVFTDDYWNTVKTAIGRLVFEDGTVGYGVNAEYIIGKWIIGQNMEISNANNTFKVTKDGVEMTSYAKKEDVNTIVSEATKDTIKSQVKQYYLSTSPTSLSGGVWSNTVPTWEDGKYIWERVLNTYGDGHIDYSPSKNGVCITGNTGKDGQDGEKGDKGDNGKDGTSYYTHIRYSASSDGSNFVSAPTSSTVYIGVYTGTSSTAPSSASSYSWSKYVGDKGATGNGINSITYYYATTTTQTVPSASNITLTTIPTLSSTNKYLWQKEVIDYTDSTVADKTSVILLAVYGDTGATGATGAQGIPGVDFSQGKMLFTDPTFSIGNNSTIVYNNSANGNVTWVRSEKSSDNPIVDSNYEMICTNIGTASPGYGGFYFNNQSRANAVFIYRIIAKIPTGRSLGFSSNSTGVDAVRKWVTSNVGTGKFTEYIYKVECGSTGTFSTTGYFYLLGGSAGTTDNPLKWYVAYATCFDMTDKSDVLSNSEKIDSVDNSLTTLITEQSATITTTAEGIIQQALKSYTTVDEFNSYKGEVSTEVKTSTEGVKIELNREIEKTSKALESTQTEISKFTKTFDFDEDGITIKTGTGGTSLRLDDEDGIIFSKNGTPFGYWDGTNFRTGNIYVETKKYARFGNYKFVPRDDGSMILVYCTPILNDRNTITSSEHFVASYTPSSYLIAGEKYNVSICITPSPGADSYGVYLSSGWACQILKSTDGTTNRQVISGTFTCHYITDKTPDINSSYGNIEIYKFPKYESGTGVSTIHWCTIEAVNQ